MLEYLKQVEVYLRLHSQISNSSVVFLIIQSKEGNVIYEYGEKRTDLINSISNNPKFYTKLRIEEIGKLKQIISPMTSDKDGVTGYIVLGIKDDLSNIHLWSILVELISSLGILCSYFSAENAIREHNGFNQIKVCLSSREHDVVSQVIVGKKDAEIAKSLCVSVPTIRKNLNSIYNKCNVYSKLELVASYYRGGFEFSYDSNYK